MDIMLSISAKPLDRHRITIVHISYLTTNIATFPEIFTHVLGENAFLQFIAVKIPRQSFYKYKFEKKENQGKTHEFSGYHRVSPYM